MSLNKVSHTIILVPFVRHLDAAASGSITEQSLNDLHDNGFGLTQDKSLLSV